MRIVEALEGKGCRIPLTKGEAELAEKLATITRQVSVCLIYYLTDIKVLIIEVRKMLLSLKVPSSFRMPKLEQTTL